MEKFRGGYLVLHPDGTPMFRCASSRAKWYLDRSLAKEFKLDGEPECIQLTFQPKGHGQAGDAFFLSKKEGKCVICGAENDLTRHHVVPYMYRRHLPDDAKANNHHDVLPICKPCHEGYERFADELKNLLAKTYDAPLHTSILNKYLSDKGLSLAISSATALLRYGHQLPPHVAQEKRQQVSDYLGHPATDAEIDGLVKESNEYCERMKDAHSRKVVTLMDVQSLVETWRQHFISTMSPKFMPPHWDVKRRYDNNGSSENQNGTTNFS